MTSDQAIRIELAGVQATLHSPYAPLVEFAGRHLARLECAGEVPVVRATLRWHDTPPPRDRDAAYPRLAGMQRIDRDLYRSDDHLAWFRVDELPGLHLQFEWDGECLSVQADYFHCLSKDPRRDQIKRLWYGRRLREMQRRRFTTLLYYLVYYPIYWWLERKSGFHPIHAGGVEIDGRIVVLAGPSGVGKSTLATALGAAPDARFLSDSFLLQHGSTVRPVREPLLLDAWSRQWLGEAMEGLDPVAWRYCLGRRGFHWPLMRLSDGGPVAVVVFPQRAAEPGLRAVAPPQAHGRISAGNLLVNDLRRYWAYAAVLEMLDPSPLAAAREAEIVALTESVPCYEIGLTKDMSRIESVAFIRDLLGRGDESHGRPRHSGQSTR